MMRVVLLAGIAGVTGCSSLPSALRLNSGPDGNAASAPLLPTPPVPSYFAIPRARTPTAPTPSQFVVNGMSSNAVVALLGQPAEKGGAAPGETWTYRSGACEVELFLFPDVKEGGLHVLDYRVSGSGSHGDEQQTCLKTLRIAQSG